MKLMGTNRPEAVVPSKHQQMNEETVSAIQTKNSFDNPSLISKVFIGGYLLIFGWVKLLKLLVI